MDTNISRRSALVSLAAVPVTLALGTTTPPTVAAEPQPSGPDLTAVRVIWDEPLTDSERAEVAGWVQYSANGIQERTLRAAVSSDQAGNFTLSIPGGDRLAVNITHLIAGFCQRRVIERDVPFTVQLADA